MANRTTPCDYGECPYNAMYGEDCRYWCGLGVDEDEYESEVYNEQLVEEPSASGTRK